MYEHVIADNVTLEPTATKRSIYATPKSYQYILRASVPNEEEKSILNHNFQCEKHRLGTKNNHEFLEHLLHFICKHATKLAMKAKVAQEEPGCVHSSNDISLFSLNRCDNTDYYSIDISKSKNVKLFVTCMPSIL